MGRVGGGRVNERPLRTFLRNMFARFGEASCDVNIKNGGKVWPKREGVWSNSAFRGLETTFVAKM